MNKIPVSVILAVKNEEKRLETCLQSLGDFEEIIIVDSMSQDKTRDVARKCGFDPVEFVWNRRYPKKRQWCLDTLSLKHDWVFFIDADEIVTKKFTDELRNLFESEPPCCGYFVRGWHIMDHKILRYGLQNSKLALFDRRKIEFPLVDDLDIPGMGEIEGHYQPGLKPGFEHEKIGRIQASILHDSMDDERSWLFRHQKYARWERGMNLKEAWPKDPRPLREFAKKYLRDSRFRPQIMFLISYIFLLGFLEGRRGLKFSKKKMEYYTLIQKPEP